MRQGRVPISILHKKQSADVPFMFRSWSKEAVGGATEDQMNDGILADMMAELDAELARAEASLPQHPEHTRQTEVMRALVLGLGNFERMRAHDVHLLAARLSYGRS